MHQALERAETIKRELTCPSYWALTLVLVKRQQRTVTLVLTGVVWVTRGVLGSLAVRSSKTKRAGTGGTTRYRHTKWHGHSAIPAILAEAGLTGIPVLAVLPQKAGSTPGHTSKHKSVMEEVKRSKLKAYRPSIQIIQQTDELNKKTNKHVNLTAQTNKTKGRVSLGWM